MKKISIRKDLMILVVFTICGIFINTLFVTLQYQLSFSYNSSLSSYDKIKINEDDKTPISEEAFSQFLFNNNETEAIIKEGQYNIVYIFDMSHKFNQIEVISGRYFTKEDFQDGNAVAVVSVDRADEIEKSESRQYIKIAGERYEVIGTFDNPDYADKVYINMISSLHRSYGFPIDGDYLVSNVETSKVDDWRNFISKNNGYTEVIKPTLIGSVKDILREYSSVVIVFLLCIFAIALNAINGIYYWLLKRKEEITIRLLVGATQSNVVKMILIDFSQKIVVSFVMSLLFSLMLFQLISVSGLNLSMWTVSASGIFLYLTGLLILAIALRGFINKDISIQVGGE